MLYRFRTGDSNMRSVWICSRNDALGNLAVMLAAVGVFGTGTAWPGLLVACVMAVLALSGAWTVLHQTSSEIREAAPITNFTLPSDNPNPRSPMSPPSAEIAADPVPSRKQGTVLVVKTGQADPAKNPTNF